MSSYPVMAEGPVWTKTILGLNFKSIAQTYRKHGLLTTRNHTTDPKDSTITYHLHQPYDLLRFLSQRHLEPVQERQEFYASKPS